MPLIATIPRPLLEDRGLLAHGFQARPPRLVASLEALIDWHERAPAETDVTRKQLIPYVVTLSGGAIFTTERLTGGNEARLHGRRSVGIGGHVEPDGHGDAGVLERGLWREWHEEVDAPEPVSLRFAGLVNDDTVEVGRYHVGLVYVATLAPGARVAVRETHKLTGAFIAREVLLGEVDRLESWSALVLQPDAVWDAVVQGG